MSVDWKDIAGIVGKVAPIAGTLIGGPAGAAIGGLVAAVLGTANTPDAITQAIATDPNAALKLAQWESDNKVKLEAMAFAHADKLVEADVASAESVNTTIQVEAKADHWPTYSWRPFIGFCVGFNTAAASVLVLGVYVPVLCGVANAAQALASLPTVLGALAAINATVLPILGIASYFRGKAQADPNVATDNRG